MRIARRPPRVLRPLLAAALAGLLAVTLLPATPASAANVKIDKRLFGMHDSDLTSWPAVSPGSVRLWDAGVTWRDIERSPGVYDFSRLDQLVRAANAHGAEVTLVLGMTPDFYAPAGGNATSMPADPAVWTNYVRAVATHYSPANWQGRRGIGAYQVWNEANVTGYWTGTPLDMAKLTKATWNAVKAVDKGALVISPAFAARIAEQIRGIQRFAFARVDGIPAWRFTDAISLNLYPKDKYGTALGTPETSMALLATARKLLGFGGVPPTKPIWNTEVNYGLASGGTGKSTAISAEKQAAYVLRTFLLNAANGVQRVDWYMWDRPQLGNTKLTTSTGVPTLAGRAFGLARSWMVGGTLVGPSKAAKPCARDRAGTYTCVITYAGGVRRVYWNPTKKVTVKTAKSATFKVGVFGKRTKIKGGSRQSVDYRPLMVRSKA